MADNSGSDDLNNLLDSNVNDQEVQMREIFNMFDQDKDGEIDMDELRRIFRQMGQDPSTDELIDVLVEVDGDGNGIIEYEEFRIMIERMVEDQEDLVIEAFKVFDKDQDGKIQIGEFGVVMKQLGENITDEEVARIYQEADADGSGEIDFEEFNEIYRNHIADD